MENPPDKTFGDGVHAVLKGLASAIPTAGGPISVLLETVFAPPIERRREKWFKHLAEVVSEIEQRFAEISREMLSQNEVFVTVALQATQIALRNHQEEKLQALRSAVLHAGLASGPDEQLQLMFLRFVDELSPAHLGLLALFDDPNFWMKRHAIQNPGWRIGNPSIIIEHCFPNLRDRRELYEQLVRDLQVRGLLSQSQFLDMTMSGTGMAESRTTQMGRSFISYVSVDV